jgi:hypothetical protein
MARAPKPTDFRVPVEGVGDFVFAKRTMADEIKVQVEFARMIDGVEPTQWLQVVCGALADLRVLTVKAPDSWDIDDLDPSDEDVYANLVKVHEAFREKERSFRRSKSEGDKASGA